MNVPRSELPQGISMCLDVASARLDEAIVLVDNGLLNQAAIVFSFAIEEFGKRAGFRDHDVKLAGAAKYIPFKHRALSQGFDPSIFTNFFGLAKTTDSADRFAGLYVN